MAKNKLVQPFLKWVGGKRQLLQTITPLLPSNMARYTYAEPFIGGGAVLFHLQPRNAILNDFNGELVNVYQVIRDFPDELILDLQRHVNDSEYFYRLRGLDRTPEFGNLTNIQRASRVIYLNKTCFNGLYRVNAAGEFNAPFGRYVNPNIVNEVTVRAVSQYLNKNNVQLMVGDYSEVFRIATPTTFLYLDPPYHPVTPTANFTGYVLGGWGDADQIRLREACDDLNQRGIKFMLSNSATPFILEQYQNYNVTIVKANRAINSVGDKRGEVDEVIVRNYG